MKDYYRIIKGELKKQDIDSSENKNTILSLIFYDYASKKYQISKTIKNIITTDNEITVLKEGIKELIQSEEKFQDIFDLIDYNENISEILKVIAKVDIADEKTYKSIFNKQLEEYDAYEDTFRISTEFLIHILSSTNNEYKKMYNPNCDHASLILQMNYKNLNVGNYYAAQSNFENYILSKMRLIVNDVGNFEIKNFDPSEYNLYDEKFQLSAAILPVYNPNEDKEFEINFIKDSLNNLTEDGMAAFIVKDSIVYSNRERNLRKFLIDNKYVSAVISISGNEDAKAKSSSILILKPNSEKVLFVNVKGKYNKSKKSLFLTDKEIKKSLSVYEKRINAQTRSRLVKLKEIIDDDYNLNLIRYVDIDYEPPVDIGKTIDKISEIKQNLSEIRSRLESENNDLIQSLGIKTKASKKEEKTSKIEEKEEKIEEKVEKVEEKPSKIEEKVEEKPKDQQMKLF